jgi:hypothetical protein
MSTKATLRCGPNHHLFQEPFDHDAVFLEIEGHDCELACTGNRSRVVVRIPLAIWEHVRGSTIAKFDLADLSDGQLAQYVRAKWEEHQRGIGDAVNKSFARAIGGLVWRGDTPEQEMASGMKWYEAERERQRSLRAEISLLQAGDGPQK